MRNTIKINDGWKFEKEGAQIGTVTLPHTWNNVDGQDGGNDYYRGACTYTKTLVVEKEEGKEYWISFGAASQQAKVYLNDVLKAEHKGGYSAFHVNLTDDIVNNQVKVSVVVTNEKSEEVYPQAADFTFYGGIYRDVTLITVPKNHFDLSYHGGYGLMVTPEKKDGSWTVKAEAYVTGGDRVVFETDGQRIEVPVEENHASAVFHLENVTVWDGVNNPYLYEMKAELGEDAVAVKYGCRTMETDPEKGFILNGKVYPLRGAARHQDRKGLGYAISEAEHEEDMAIIREMGANTIRLAHYQHDPYFYDLCDKYGIVVWAEIPYITMHMPGGRENTVQQMRDLIVQNYNHPSIACWGLSNEITAASAVDEDLLENHRILNDLCHKMDPARFTTMANVFMLETDSEILNIPDVNSYNLYFGWYLGELDENDRFFDEYHSKYPERVIGFSEYGADANPAFHNSNPEKGDYTEEYQCVYHEHILKMIEERPYLWATHLWNMFDFAADGRDEGGKHGENQKGLVTFDRKIRKDAFYLYKAHWNQKEPFVHLCGRRYMNRCEDETKVKVYSNQNSVTLYADGEKLETKYGKHIFEFNVKLTGEHTIRAVSGDVSDEMILKKVEEFDTSYALTGNAPVKNWFDDIAINPAYYSIRDTLGAIRESVEGNALVTRIMEEGARARGEVAQAANRSEALTRMMNRMTMQALLKQAGMAEDMMKNINDMLQKIKKN